MLGTTVHIPAVTVQHDSMNLHEDIIGIIHVSYEYRSVLFVDYWIRPEQSKSNVHDLGFPSIKTYIVCRLSSDVANIWWVCFSVGKYSMQYMC